MLVLNGHTLFGNTHTVKLIIIDNIETFGVHSGVVKLVKIFQQRAPQKDAPTPGAFNDRSDKLIMNAFSPNWHLTGTN